MATATLKSRFDEYKTEIETLEETVKKWKEEAIADIGRLSQDCYDSFNNLQMTIAKFKDLEQKERHEKTQYRETYDFLVFVENKMNTDLYVLLVNNILPFNRLIRHYKKYCFTIEAKYDIELSSERELQTEKKLKKK